MAWTRAKDISQWQGNWQDTGEPIVFIKASGGDNGLYFDSKCTSDYSAATAAGKAVGLYHFIGWTIGAEQEAAYFVRAVSPLAENDVYALDIENGSVPVPGNAPQYVLDMVNYIHDKTGAYPLVYMNLSTLNAHDWSAVLANCGLWLADWAVSPDATIPTNVMYVMQQYSDGPGYDHDAFFGTVDQFKKYGYHASQNAQQTTPTPQPQPNPAPAPTPSPSPEPVPTPVTAPTSPTVTYTTPTKSTTTVTITTPTTGSTTTTTAPVKKQNWFVRCLHAILKFLDIEV